MTRIAAALALVVASAFLAIPTNATEPDCVGLRWPVSGPVVASYAPNGRYAGHWGVDVAVQQMTDVRSAASGHVTFAGTVVGNQTVTIHHGGGLRTSYSYLESIHVSAGSWIPAGVTVGASGIAHGLAEGERGAVHLSVRVDGKYVDPLGWFGCHPYAPGRALRLVE